MNLAASSRQLMALLAVVIGSMFLLAQGVTEEVPIGTVTGRLTIADSERPLPNVTVYLMPDVRDDERLVRNRMARTDENGEFVLRNVLAGTYQLSVAAKAHRMANQTVVVEDGKRFHAEYPLMPVPPYLHLNYASRVWLPTEPIQLTANGFVRADEIIFHVYEASLDSLLDGSSFRQEAYREAQRFRSAPANGEARRRIEHRVRNRDGEGVFVDDVHLDPLPEGMYWIVAEAGSTRQVAFANVTTIAAVTKADRERTLCYITDIRTGQPIPNVTVRSGPRSGTTDDDGLITFTRTGTEASEQTIVARRGDSHAIVDYWVSSGGGNEQISVYTDRPVYRPGDTIYFKGLVRRLTPQGYRPLPPSPVTIQVRDGRGDLVYEESTTTLGAGSFAGSIPSTPSDRPGDYEMTVRVGESTTWRTITIASYRKPEVSARIEFDRPYYVQGQVIEATVSAEYYFGGPVVGAEVSGWTFREADTPWRSLFNSENDFGGDAESLGEGMLDSQGRLKLRIPTRLRGRAPLRGDELLTVSVTVREPGGTFAVTSAEVRIVQGHLNLTVDPERYVAQPGETTRFAIRVLGRDRERPLASREVQVLAERQVWHEGRLFSEPIAAQNVRTNSAGIAEVRFRAPDEGNLFVRAVAKDDAGNEVHAQAEVFVYGGASEWSHSRLTAVLDRGNYALGDVATLVVASSSPGGTALVTVEAETILWHQMVPLSRQATEVQIPVTQSMLPNAQVSVVYIRDKQFDWAEESIRVTDERHILTVEVTPVDGRDYAPGDTVRYRVRTQDRGGQPVAAEFSLGVVDESVYAIREDRYDPVEAFYPMRYSAVLTTHSFPFLYLDSENKGPATAEVRRDFRDTADWLPILQTDDSGTAEVTVRLPDNVTGWRATAIAITDDGKVGRGTATVRARKPLMVRLQPPNFLTIGDEQTLSAIVTNGSDQRLDATVTLQAQGGQIMDAGSRQVSLDAGRSAPVAWRVRAAEASTARFLVRGTTSQGPSDAMEWTVPIRAWGREERFVRGGRAEDRAEVELGRSPNAVPGFGGLRVTITPSLAALAVTRLDGLIDFPYGCVEQTMSRFLPTVVAMQATQELGLPAPRRASDVTAIVRAGYARLRDMQNESGTWGWFYEEQWDPEVTAYVLEGLFRAQQAGYPPDPGLLRRALEGTEAAVRSNVASRDLQRPGVAARLAYALALWDRLATARIVLERTLGEIPGDARAPRALAFHRLGDTAARDAELRQLRSAAVREGDRVVWRTSSPFGEAEATAWAALALATVAPSDPLLDGAQAYLVQQSDNRWWGNTAAESRTVLALLAIAQGRGERPAQVARIEINGGQVAEFWFASGSDAETFLLPISQVPQRANLAIVPQGGSVYYQLDFTQQVRSQTLAAQATPSLSIERAYYVMEPRRLSDGTTRLMRGRNPTTSFRVGDSVQVVLTIRTEEPVPYAMIEDPFPAAFLPATQTSGGYEYGWTAWYGGIQMLDDRASFFGRWLPRGESTIVYNLKPTFPGKSRALPATVGNMYDRASFATSSGLEIEVRER